jgi:hypothetical protein
MSEPETPTTPNDCSKCGHWFHGDGPCEICDAGEKSFGGVWECSKTYIGQK